MSETPRFAMIIGSTRPTRFADKPADWLLDYASRRDDMTLEKVDLRNFDLPFFAEKGTNAQVPTEDPKAIAWQDAIRPYDGYIFIVAEYHRSITGALKNAIDQAYTEWVRKPFSALAYGFAGGVRAVEHLRTIGVGIQMVPSSFSAHIGGSDFRAVQQHAMSAIEDVLKPPVDTMLTDLVWWANVLTPARNTT